MARKLTYGDVLHVYDVLKALHKVAVDESSRSEEIDDLLDLSQEALDLLEEVLYEDREGPKPSHPVHL